MGKFTSHNNLFCGNNLHGNIGIGTDNPSSTLEISGSLTVSGAVAYNGGVVFNEDGSADDFRVEGDTLPNLLLLDGSADRIYITDAATGGTIPTAPTGGLTTGSLLVLQNNSAASDDMVLTMIAGATSGNCIIEFGDSGDANIGSIDYAHASNSMTFTTNTASSLVLGTAGAVFNEGGVATLDFRVESDNLANLLLVDSSADIVYVTDAATGGTPPTAPTGNFTTGTLLAVQNNSAATDNAIVALIAGATSGLSGLDLGDANDANIGSVLYDHSTNVLTVTTNTANSMTLGPAGAVFNEGGAAALDFRVESDNFANCVLVDSSADRVFLTDAATGGTPPTDPTGGFAAGTFLAIVNNSAGGDDAIMALIADAATGLSEIHFGDANDANAGIVSYNHATDTYTFTAGTTAVATLAAAAFAAEAAVTINDAGAAYDFRVEGDTLPNLFLLDSSADQIYITDAATGGTIPTAPTVGHTAGTLLIIDNRSVVGDNAVLALIAGTSGVSQVNFGDANSAVVGHISYSHGGDTMTFDSQGYDALILSAAGAVFNDGATSGGDLRAESDNFPNMFFLDASADRIFLSDAATGGTPPTDPTGGYSTGTFLAVVNNSAGGDDAIIALISDATSGLSEIHFGDADDANIGIISYDNAANDFTFTASTTAAMEITSTGVNIAGIADANQLVLGTANMALSNGDNDNVTNPGAAIAYITGPTAAFTISGITAGTDGQVLIIINNVAQNCTLEDEEATSTAANRILTGTGGDVATTAAGHFILVYSGTSSRWHLIGAPAELA